jgi:hypothetical protein
MIPFFLFVAVCGAIAGCLVSWPMLVLISVVLVVAQGIYEFWPGNGSIVSFAIAASVTIAVFQVCAVFAGFVFEIALSHLRRANSSANRTDEPKV